MIKLLRSFRKILLFAIPFFVIFIAYLVIDPFMVLYSYDDYNKDPHIHKNLDYITSEKYMNNSREIEYDSYIFGGSTALYVSPSAYRQHLNPEGEVYSFIASGEHITGIWSKIKYLYEHERPIKNALLVLDMEGTFDAFINNIPMAMKHYEIYPSSKLNFQYKYFLDFINLRFLLPYLHYSFTNEFHPYMEGTLLDYEYYHDHVTNEYYNLDILERMQKDSIGYYEERKHMFGPRTGDLRQYEPKIKAEYMVMLEEIKKIFELNNTRVRVLIGPNYFQKSISKKDLQALNNFFGEENVFDFTGVNEFSKDASNFYDEVHFKKYIGDKMLELIYAKDEQAHIATH